MAKLDLALKNLESFGLNGIPLGELEKQGVTYEFLTSEEWYKMV